MDPWWGPRHVQRKETLPAWLTVSEQFCSNPWLCQILTTNLTIVMLASDLTLDSSVAIAAGTANSTVYSLLGGNSPTSSIRSVAAVSATAPKTIRVAHSTRTEKSFKTVANQSVPAPDITFDRHLIRLDATIVQTQVLDPAARVKRSVQIVFESPRLGSESPTTTQLVDDLLALVASLRASTNANAIRLFNGET